jgi:uncharacterized membrane protein YjgN (DUF898 family)
MSSTLKGEYGGTARALFWLALRTAMLTTLTLGIYRFWSKTRIRQYVWSAVSADGDSFEYTGTGLEKFLGFLAAIVVLALYLGAVQMILFYFGLTIFGSAETQVQAQAFSQFGALGVTSLAVMPLVFFAHYRARRYKLSRTRWRGLRFAAEAGAWGYVWRAMWHWALTLMSLGLLLPRMTFCLEKYKADRSWYGDAPFHQGGRWQGLYPAMKHLVIGAGLILLSGAFALSGAWVMMSLWGVLGVIWIGVGALSYKIHSFTYLARHLSLGDMGAIKFDAAPDTWTILWQMISGGLLVSLATGAALALLGAIPLAMIGSDALPFGLAIIPLVLGYMLALAISSALSLIWVTQPILRHVVAGCLLHGASVLDGVVQRNADTDTDAEGFADALDIGGAL